MKVSTTLFALLDFMDAQNSNDFDEEFTEFDDCLYGMMERQINELAEERLINIIFPDHLCVAMDITRAYKMIALSLFAENVKLRNEKQVS